MNEVTAGPVDHKQLFPVSVMVTSLTNTAALNAALTEIIQQNKAQSSGINRSNILGWHSDLEMLRWGGEPAKTLGLAMLQLCGRHTDDVRMAEGSPPRYEMIMEMWANVSPTGASNQFHAHPGRIWSGVYYVDDGDDAESALVLMDPNFPMNRMNAPDLQFVGPNGERFPSRHEVAPEPGRLVVFPSWLNHAVKPYNGPRERISIAMNVMAFPIKSAGV